MSLYVCKYVQAGLVHAYTLTQVWGKFFSSVDLFASDQSLVVPAHTIKQRVFVLLIHAVTMDAKAQG